MRSAASCAQPLQESSGPRGARTGRAPGQAAAVPWLDPGHRVLSSGGPARHARSPASPAAASATRGPPSAIHAASASRSGAGGRSASSTGTRRRTASPQAAVPRPGASGRRRSSACAAAQQLRPPRRRRTFVHHAPAACAPPMGAIETWSSIPADGRDRVHRRRMGERLVLARPAPPRCTAPACSPESSPGWRARNAGRPLCPASTSRSIRRSPDDPARPGPIAATVRAPAPPAGRGSCRPTGCAGATAPPPGRREDQRVVGGAAQLALQRPTPRRRGASRGRPHHLGRAAQRVRVLHAAAVRVRAHERAVGESARAAAAPRHAAPGVRPRAHGRARRMAATEPSSASRLIAAAPTAASSRRLGVGAAPAPRSRSMLGAVDQPEPLLRPPARAAPGRARRSASPPATHSPRCSASPSPMSTSA